VPSPDATTRLAPPSGPWSGPVPVADIDSAPFWAGLRRHELAILRCDECRTFVHPPQASCPKCLSLALTAEVVSGRGSVYSFTVVNREFAPGIKPPYAAALVDLVEQDGLRLVTNLVNVTLADLRIGMPVRVVFHDLDGQDVTLAFFEPS
jgi:uncharacterized OB-fold protein